MTLELAEETETLSICSRFSRLILDPQRSLISETLIRKVVELDVILDMNKDGNKIMYNPINRES